MKKEFKLSNNKKKSSKMKTRLKEHQKWIQNYISPQTPYKGVLLFHETGSGKTCSAITIAENFREEQQNLGKKIFIISADAIKKEFIKNIYNKDSTFKCAGSVFEDIVVQDGKKINNANIQHEIFKYYEFQTYQKFGDKVIDDEKGRSFKKIYSDSVIIVDEAHKLRSNQSTSKSIVLAIEKITKQCQNVRLIFLTATPIFDNPSEIIWLINMLIRVNEDTVEELTDAIFETDTADNYNFRNDAAITKFKRAIRGKVSFVRSSNPQMFPLKLYDTTAKIPNTTIGHNGNEFTKFDTDSIKLSLSKLNKKYTGILINKHIENADAKMTIANLERSNVFWYKDTTSYFKIETRKNLRKYTAIGEVLNNLDQYAPKIHTIINHIRNCEGICLVYSQFLDHGLIPMALALENIGFTNYGMTPLLKNPKLENKPDLKYCVITSNEMLKANPETLDVLKSEKNKDGNIIKVVLISEAGSTGIDLKFIRQVHILEPYWNMSQIEQVIGRAVRINSHSILEKCKRNTHIFFHANEYDESNERQDTYDINVYKLALSKMKIGNQVKKIMQESSVSCDVFKNINTFTFEDYQKAYGSNINDSEGNVLTLDKSIHFGHENKKYAEKCLNTCDLKEHIDEMTYNPHLHQKWELILTIEMLKNMYGDSNKYSITEIKEYINYYNPNIDDETIFIALDTILNQSIKNNYEVEGYIEFNDGFFEFFPKYSRFQEPILYQIGQIVLNEKNTIPRVKDSTIYELGNTFQMYKKMLIGDTFWMNIVEFKKLLADALFFSLNYDKRDIIIANKDCTNLTDFSSTIRDYEQMKIQINKTINDPNKKPVDKLKKLDAESKTYIFNDYITGSLLKMKVKNKKSSLGAEIKKHDIINLTNAELGINKYQDKVLKNTLETIKTELIMVSMYRGHYNNFDNTKYSIKIKTPVSAGAEEEKFGETDPLAERGTDATT